MATKKQLQRDLAAALAEVERLSGTVVNNFLGYSETYDRFIQGEVQTEGQLPAKFAVNTAKVERVALKEDQDYPGSYKLVINDWVFADRLSPENGVKMYDDLIQALGLEFGEQSA